MASCGLPARYSTPTPFSSFAGDNLDYIQSEGPAALHGGNATKVLGRQVAVDWCLPKDVYGALESTLPTSPPCYRYNYFPLIDTGTLVFQVPNRPAMLQ